MQLKDPLDDVFRGRSHAPVLRALLRLPDGIGVSIREIARRAGVTHPTASGVLESFRAQGLALRRRTLLADEYRINPSHVLVSPLRRLLDAETEVPDSLEHFLRNQIVGRAPWVHDAYLFGSAVTGDMRPDSDIDVALICPPRREPHLSGLMDEVSDETAARFGNRLGVLIGTKPISELARPGRPGYRIWQQVKQDGRRLLPGEGA